VNVLFTIGGLHPASGGPSRSVPALCDALAVADVQVELVSHHYGAGRGAPLKPHGSDIRTTFVDCSGRLAQRLQWTPRFTTVLRERCRDFLPDILHDTGVWLSTNHAAAAIAKEQDIPRVISPRGMLTAWSLRHKSWKKNLAWKFYQQRDLATANLLHATSAAEAEDFRALGFTQPFAIIPNGVELPPLNPAPHPATAKRTALFLSRIHPKKGLLDLVAAWAQLKPDGWRVVIAGGDDENHRAEVEAAVRASGLDADFTFVGEVDSNSRWELYRAADLFILPSHSENFGIVIAEALTCGVPVITTRATPWAGIPAHQCGWWVDTGMEALVAALHEAVALSDEDRRAMGARGRAWVEKDFSWNNVGAQMKSVYHWLLHAGAKPDCVV
jgi:glycosyltransferase involved in cell wall biosynthesis